MAMLQVKYDMSLEIPALRPSIENLLYYLFVWQKLSLALGLIGMRLCERISVALRC
jgi:hypothetical protein